jgi:ribosomal protein S18 acetylase RimI-like enzyme
MSTTLIEIRRAKSSDAKDVAGTHDDAWRAAYQGIIPGNELDKLINRRGPDWWDSAIRKGSRITILQFGDKVAGYANYGRNRARSLFYDGEVYELYLRPEFQGLGFGRRLFTAARKDLVQSGLKTLVVWALSDNEPAMEFYRALGGRAVARSSEKFGDVCFAEAVQIAGSITPVPGGVGPMTIACLLANTLRAACMQNDLPAPKF